MTTSAAPDDTDLLAFLDGQLEPSAHAAFEARLSADPALRAEVEGLQAVRGLLDNDATWGVASKIDVPPPHLLQAILTAEVAARPDAIRQAAALSRDPARDPKRPLWARLSSWLVGGGALVGATAAILVVSQQSPSSNEMAAPVPATATATALPEPAPVLKAAEPEAAFGYADEARADEDGGDRETNAVKGDARQALQERSVADSKQRLEGSLGGSADAKPQDSFDDLVGSGSAGRGLGAKDVAENKLNASATRRAVDTSNAATDTPMRPMGKRDAAGRDAFALADKESDGDNFAAADGEEAAPPPPPAAPAAASPAADAPAPRMVSADEARRSFLRKRSSRYDAKESAKAAPGEPQKLPPAKSAAKKNKSKALPKPEAQSSMGASMDDELDGLRPSEKAREELARSRQMQQATSTLISAEHELQTKRFQSALDLSQQAEALAGGRLGSAPAAIQTQALFFLGRHADAARISSRLINGDVADPAVVDGLLAGAQACAQIGDTRLGRQLLTAALKPENTDAGRRQRALDLLTTLDGPRYQRASKAEAETKK